MTSPPKSHIDQDFTFYEMWALHCDGMNAVDHIRELEGKEPETSEKKIIEFLESCDSEGEALLKLKRQLIAGRITCLAMPLGGSTRDEFKIRRQHWHKREFRYPPPEAVILNSPTSTPWELLAFSFRDAQKMKAKKGRPKGSKYTEWVAPMHKRIETEGIDRTTAAKDMGKMLHKLDPAKYASDTAATQGLLDEYRKVHGPAKH